MQEHVFNCVTRKERKSNAMPCCSAYLIDDSRLFALPSTIKGWLAGWLAGSLSAIHPTTPHLRISSTSSCTLVLLRGDHPFPWPSTTLGGSPSNNSIAFSKRCLPFRLACSLSLRSSHYSFFDTINCFRYQIVLSLYLRPTTSWTCILTGRITNI